ncbi:MAG: response regulator [Acidobacteriota bacterium]
MRILIAEDDLVSRKFLFKFLSKFGDCDITVDGMEAVEAFLLAGDEGRPYELICLDVMMPKLDGLKVLKAIRDIEAEHGVPENKVAKIIMTTVMNDTERVMDAFQSGCQAYAAKPIDIKKLQDVLGKLGLTNQIQQESLQ